MSLPQTSHMLPVKLTNDRITTSPFTDRARLLLNEHEHFARCFTSSAHAERVRIGTAHRTYLNANMKGHNRKLLQLGELTWIRKMCLFDVWL